MAHAINYIEGPLILERFISTVVNSSCEDLQKIDIFKWNKPGVAHILTSSQSSFAIDGSREK